MKKFFALLILFSLVWGTLAAAPFAIVYNKNVTQAKELKSYLDKIISSSIPLYKEQEFKVKLPAIYVGDTAFARKNKVDFARFAPEEWCYKSIGKNLILGGHRHNGVTFAVYTFLEKELGCRFYTFESELVPKRKNVRLTGFNKKGKPDFIGRGIYTPVWNQHASAADYKKMWAHIRKLRGNFCASPQIMTRQFSDCHNFYAYVPPEKYFKTHPEYFSMNEAGKRFHGKNGGGGQLCMTNKEVAEVTFKSLVEYIKKDRAKLPGEKWPIIYDISQLDNTNYMCLCPPCKALAEKEGSESALVLTYINAVARKVAKLYPEITIQTFAYVSTELPPKTIRPEKNVRIRYCDLYTRSDCYRPITSKFNIAQKKKLDAWKKLGVRIALWDYWNMDLPGPYFTPPRVETMIDAIPGDLRYFKSVGVEQFMTETEHRIYKEAPNFADLQVYLGYQLSNDTSLDAEKLIADFVKNHYGAASKEVGEFLALVRKSVKAEKKALIYITNPVREYQTGPFLKKCYDILIKAQNKVKNAPRVRLRVERELLTVIATILHNPQLGTGLDRKALVKEYARIRNSLIDAYCAKEFHKKLKKDVAKAVEKLTLEIPTPPQFKHLPADKIKKFAYPAFSAVVDDPDSIIGKAMPSGKEALNRKHIMKAQAGGIYPTWFGCYDHDSKKGSQLRINKIPQDEKYHWYKMGKFDFGRRTILWGWFWYRSANLSSVYTNADGLPGFNTWTVWVSVKITGPAYVKGSKKPNNVLLDQIILVKE